MPSRTRPPEELQIELPTDGDWIKVKKHLTWIEAREAEARQFKSVGPGRQELDLRMIGAVWVAAYLLDWSILDADGLPIGVRRKGADDILAALGSLDEAKGAEVIEAVTAHRAAMAAAIEAQKKQP